jgi:hypothetical protein
MNESITILSKRFATTLGRLQPQARGHQVFAGMKAQIYSAGDRHTAFFSLQTLTGQVYCSEGG